MKLLRLDRSIPCLALAAVLAACGPQQNAGVYVPPNLSEAELAALVSTTWQGLQDAPWQTPYSGTRSVEFTVTEGEGFPVTVRYKERITTDGQGGYEIQPLYAESPVFPDEGTFLLLQEQRQGFFFRYRDFAIRDADAVVDNYQLVGNVVPVTIAGRPCQEAQLARTVPGGRHYQVAFDVETGVPLRYIEFDDNVNQVAKMEFDSVDFAPSFAGVAFHQPGNQEVDLDVSDAALATQALGFAPRVPTYVPPGFRLMESARVEDLSGRRWLKLAYTDGVEMVFLLHREVVGTDYALPTTFSATRASSRRPEQVMVFNAGPVTVAQGTLGDAEYIVVGEAPESDLLQMLDSAR